MSKTSCRGGCVISTIRLVSSVFTSIHWSCLATYDLENGRVANLRSHVIFNVSAISCKYEFQFSTWNKCVTVLRPEHINSTRVYYNLVVGRPNSTLKHILAIYQFNHIDWYFGVTRKYPVDYAVRQALQQHVYHYWKFYAGEELQRVITAEW